MFSLSPQPQATGGGRRNHLSPPNLNVVLFISLFLILMAIPSFISFTSQVFTPLLVEVLKTKHGLRLVLLLVFVTVCVFLTINNSENTSSYNRNDEHACNNSGGDLLNHQYQQRESKLHPKTTPTTKEHIQKSVETILNPQKPSSTSAQKPPLPDKKVRSNRVDDQDVMRSGTSSPSPQAGARRRRKPLSPLNGSSCSSDDEITSSRSDSPSFIPLPPPSPPFKIRPHDYTTYVWVHSDNSSSCDSADSMTGSPDVNVKAEHFIGNYWRS